MKRIMIVLFALLLSASAVLTVSAKNIQTFGDWTVVFSEGEDLAFTVDSCSSQEEQITVPDTLSSVKVNAIGSHAMMNNTTMRSITMNQYIKCIDKYAFLNCSSLETVNLTPAVTEIGESAFSGTSALRNINLEDSSVDVINSDTFLNSGIVSVILPDSCQNIADNAFAQCDALEKIVIPTSVTSIADQAFRECDNLVIYCYTGSYAQEYAEAHDIPYVLLDAPLTFILGDADGDGYVTIVDATRIQRVLVELDDDPDGMIALRGSADGEKLNIMHATKIQRWLALFEVEEPIGEEVTRTLG